MRRCGWDRPLSWPTLRLPIVPWRRTYNNPLCDEEVWYHDSLALDAFPTVALKEQYLYPRVKLYGSTRLNICENTMDDINARGRADHHASSSRPNHPTITTTTAAIVLAVIGVMVFDLMFY